MSFVSEKELVEKPVFAMIGGGQPHFCFSADMCGRKTPFKRKSLKRAVFKDAWVVLAGVECNPKI